MGDPLDFSSSDEEEHVAEKKEVKEEEAPFRQQRHQMNKKDHSKVDHDEREDSTQTPIQNRYVFWFMHRGNHKGGNQTSIDNFEQALIPVASFQTVEHFWRVYDHIARPPSIQSSGQTTFHLFKNGIKPTWEDPNNARGGAWIVRLPKGLAARFWEELLLAIIGEQFDVGNEICGAKLSVRFSEDVISLWNRNADNTEATEKIRDLMRRLMRIPSFIHIEYKRHELSLGDKLWSGVQQDGQVNHQGYGSGPRGGNSAFGSMHPSDVQPVSSRWNGIASSSSPHHTSGVGGSGRNGSMRGDTSGMGSAGGKGGGRDWNNKNINDPPVPVRDLNAKWR
jgi:translation initiation factor 4E